MPLTLSHKETAMEQKHAKRTKHLWCWKMVRTGLLLYYYGIGLLILTVPAVFFVLGRGFVNGLLLLSVFESFFGLLFLAGSCAYCFCPRELVYQGGILAFSSMLLSILQWNDFPIFLSTFLSFLYFPEETLSHNPGILTTLNESFLLSWGLILWFYGKLAYAVDCRKPVQSFWMSVAFLFLAGLLILSVPLFPTFGTVWEMILPPFWLVSFLLAFLAYIGMLKYMADALGKRIREEEKRSTPRQEVGEMESMV